VNTPGGWRDVAGEPVACWLSGNHDSPLGVVLLPPIAYEYSSAARTMTALSHALGDKGAFVVTVDYPGTGDSAGETNSLASWRAALTDAVALARGSGLSKVALIGAGWGAAMALQSAEESETDAVVAIAPPLSGRRYVRQLRMLGLPDPDASGGVSVGGYYLPGALLEDMSHCVVTLPASCPVLIVDKAARDERSAEPDVLVTRWTAAGVAGFLERPAEEAETAVDLIEDVVSWLSDTLAVEPAAVHRRLPRPTALVRPGVTETFVTWGDLPGVLTKGQSSTPVGLLVLLNSGSDPHTGPGRAWVDLARFIAEQHHWGVLRFDARGWGRAQEGPVRDARPYDLHMRQDISKVVTAARSQGWGQLVLGLCAGAWIALDSGRTGDVDGVVALNPQLYWQVGDPVEALLTTTIARRSEETAAIQRGQDAGQWDRDDEAGLRTAAGQWLDELDHRRVPIELVFAQDDPGLTYLRQRLSRRLNSCLEAGLIRVSEVADIDHGMHRTWQRDQVFRCFGKALDRMHATAGQ
jgi:dienelactone hydrolase